MRPAQIFPRLRWILAAAGLACGAQGAVPAFAFDEATIEDLQARMNAGWLTSQELTAAYLQRIAEIDQAGPGLKAVIELNPDAPAIAAQLDAERMAGKVRGPLHGIPVLIKDNIGTADRMETTAGSLALVGAKPARDAHLVTLLREAGAVILGKTNLSEWGLFRDGKARSGWSGRGGQTRNPYALDSSPSGSSSGSGAAVAANLCVVAVGTETDGSILSPASVCGIVGVKPTVGLVSRSGLIPISVSQDTPGAMARTVRDAAILLEVLAGPDGQDAATLVRERPAGTNYAAPFRRRALRGARLGVVTGPFGLDPKLNAPLEEAVAALKSAGAVIVCSGDFPKFLRLDDPEREVLLYEFKAGINNYLASLGPDAPMKSLADLIAYNQKHPAQEMPYFKQQIFLLAQAKGPLTEPAYRDALESCRRISRTEGIDYLMDKYRLDALVALTGPPAWLIERSRGQGTATLGGSYQPAAVAGYPSITVPATQVDGLPVGLSFIGRPWSESLLLAFAANFEAATQERQVPKFLPQAAATSKKHGAGMPVPWE